MSNEMRVLACAECLAQLATYRAIDGPPVVYHDCKGRSKGAIEQRVAERKASAQRFEQEHA